MRYAIRVKVPAPGFSHDYLLARSGCAGIWGLGFTEETKIWKTLHGANARYNKLLASGVIKGSIQVVEVSLLAPFVIWIDEGLGWVLLDSRLFPTVGEAMQAIEEEPRDGLLGVIKYTVEKRGVTLKSV